MKSEIASTITIGGVAGKSSTFEFFVVAMWLRDVRFSNRPVRVKRFQTIHHCSVDVAHGLVLLFGIGTMALPSWGAKTGWNNLEHISAELNLGFSILRE
jgi:hypothetical protein